MNNIKVMIVDDEELVRKSLIRLVPWEAHGMEVVSEAGNGQAALDYLRNNEVDLIFLDLAMPVMDGFALLEICEEEFPRLVKVVLTCHDEAESYRKTMRMGTVDYLCKTNFSFEKMDELLDFLAGKVRSQRHQSRVACLVSTGADQLAQTLEEQGSACTRLSPKILLLPEAGDALLKRLREREDVVLFHFYQTDLPTLTLHPKWMEEYADCVLFYIDGAAARECDLQGWQVGMDLGYPEGDELENELSEGKWLLYGQEVRDIADRLVKHRFSGEKLRGLIARMRRDLRGLYPRDAGDGPSLEHAGFAEVRAEMEDMHRVVQTRLNDPRDMMSEQILLAVLKAITLVRDRRYITAGQEKIARLVGVSRSYFSKCFKQVTGGSFSDFQRRERILFASELLATTDMPLYAIAQACSFEDERYFAAVYQELTHLHPAAYRRNAKLHQA